MLLHVHVSEKWLFEGSEKILYIESKLDTGFKENFMEAKRTGLRNAGTFPTKQKVVSCENCVI